MAQAILRLRHSLCCALMIGMLAPVSSASLAGDKAVGMTLLFQSAGRSVGVKRFDPDGMRGPVPGAVGGMFPKGGAIMSFMPGDRKRGVPKFVDVEWVAPTAEAEAWERNQDLLPNSVRYSTAGLAESKRISDQQPHFTKRIDLTTIITPQLLAQVRADAQNTQLKLIITFNNDEVDIKAQANKWR